MDALNITRRNVFLHTTKSSNLTSEKSTVQEQGSGTLDTALKRRSVELRARMSHHLPAKHVMSFSLREISLPSHADKGMAVLVAHDCNCPSVAMKSVPFRGFRRPKMRCPVGWKSGTSTRTPLSGTNRESIYVLCACCVVVDRFIWLIDIPRCPSLWQQLFSRAVQYACPTVQQ